MEDQEEHFKQNLVVTHLQALRELAGVTRPLLAFPGFAGLTTIINKLTRPNSGPLYLLLLSVCFKGKLSVLSCYSICLLLSCYSYLIVQQQRQIYFPFMWVAIIIKQ